MSYSVDERLPEDYFKEVMEEKAEMLNMFLDDLGNPLILLSYCGHTMLTFKFYSFDDNNDSLRLHYTFSKFQFGTFRKSVVLLMDTT